MLDSPSPSLGTFLDIPPVSRNILGTVVAVLAVYGLGRCVCGEVVCVWGGGGKERRVHRRNVCYFA